jgi:hypothetical protein
VEVGEQGEVASEDEGSGRVKLGDEAEKVVLAVTGSTFHRNVSKIVCLPVVASENFAGFARPKGALVPVRAKPDGEEVARQAGAEGREMEVALEVKGDRRSKTVVLRLGGDDVRRKVVQEGVERERGIIGVGKVGESMEGGAEAFDGAGDVPGGE